MRFTYLIYLLYILVLFNCKQPKEYLTKIEGKQIQITDSLAIDQDIEAFIKPYRTHIKKDLDSVLAFSAGTYTKSDGEFNTAIGNFMADAVFDEANPVFKKRTGKDIDMVILNHGGIRSIINKGNITTRTAFELMPFENSIIVVAMKGSQIDSLVNYLSKAYKAHPISKLKLSIDKNFDVIEALINGQEIDPHKTYYVATNDYLYNGGDDMTFFKPNEEVYVLDYKIRNALIDNFKKVDTISPIMDDRFIMIK
ncbi:5'-nucleotidase C-terminal domain-containing protein [Mariniflexile gromovii]|uniref:5'-nucleotidase C-terminal domain-containing protein n=1 Tax=Mariniflexile gromovii TaxID=362523 RepID=A0ABS4BX53_9FLAO|nr:5'-nucleotidase [Mariniflexile gromovii]MBP0905179.1 5'-nucleotidase C-terminal domain-containing protein [Mariniflexile gromovii]